MKHIQVVEGKNNTHQYAIRYSMQVHLVWLIDINAYFCGRILAIDFYTQKHMTHAIVL